VVAIVRPETIIRWHRLRRLLPRKTDLNLITAAALKGHVQRLNDTPRKCLDFKTPAEAFSKLKSIVALQT
jgi:transposase, IS30 family